MGQLVEKFETIDSKLLYLDDTRVITNPKENEVELILREFHDSPTGGHTGTMRMLKNFREKFKWKNMAKEIEEYVKRCPKCQVNKINRKPVKNPMLITSTSSRTFARIALDIVGPLAETSKKNIYILSFQDDLTKVTLFAPLQTIEAETVADIFFHKFISHFGIQSSILIRVAIS